jgi:hypothetical protein
MACSCGKNERNIELDKAVAMATNESDKEKSNYVVYEFEKKYTYDKKSCWEKAGRPGTLERIIYPV